MFLASQRHPGAEVSQQWIDGAFQLVARLLDGDTAACVEAGNSYQALLCWNN